MSAEMAVNSAGRSWSDRLLEDLPGRLRWLVPSAIVALALLVRLILFVGIRRLDMFRYLELSNHVLSGGSLFDEGVFYASRRLALMLPLLLSNALGGYGEHVSTAWPLLCSLGSVLVVYLMGTELWNWRVGALAALAMAFYPLEVELGTQLLPDPIAGFLVVLAVYLSVLAVRRDRGSAWYSVASGAALGVAFFARENILVFLPGLMLVGLMLDTPRWKRTLWAPAGVLGVVALAALGFWVFFGNPIIDWMRFREFYSTYQAAGFVELKTTFWREFLDQAAFAGFLAAVVLGAVAVVFDRSRGRWVMLAWAVGFWLFLDVAGPILGMDVSYRYAEPIMPPLLLLAAAGVGVMGKRLRRESLVMALAAFSVLLLLPWTYHVVSGWKSNPRWLAIEQAERVVSRGPRAAVIVDYPWVFTVINYYNRYGFARDTLMPADASVNAKARLFMLGERPLPETGPAFLVLLDKPVPEGVKARQIAQFPYRGAQILRVYEVAPR